MSRMTRSWMDFGKMVALKNARRLTETQRKQNSDRVGARTQHKFHRSCWSYAKLCFEPAGGARVTTNTRLDIQNLSRFDDRRIEVIANGLPMWGGSQPGVDTTLVSPLMRSGPPRSQGGTYAGAAVQDAQE